MLCPEQKIAFENSLDLYETARFSPDGVIREDKAPLLEEAFSLLADFAADAEDIPCKVLFLSIIQERQKMGQWQLPPGQQEIKISCYQQVFDWFQKNRYIMETYRELLWNIFDRLGQIWLKGDEMPQDDGSAWNCYRNNCLLLHPVAGYMMDLFTLNEEGQWVFTGNRPK